MTEIDMAEDLAVAKERTDSRVFVEESAMPAFRKRLDALNKKAEAFGLEPVRIVSEHQNLYKRERETIVEGDNQYVQTRMVRLKPDEWEMFPIKINEIEIEYPIIKLGNWQVVGKLEVMGGSNLMFAVSQKEEDVDAIRERVDHPVTCDHCKVNRNRKDGFVLRDDASGKYMQVGSNCLKDFTGIDPAAALFLTRMYDLIKVVDQEFSEYGRGGSNRYVDTRLFLSTVSFLVDYKGFVSAKKADETMQAATYTDAMSINNLLEKRADARERFHAQFEAQYAKAATIIEWAGKMNAVSDFERNAQVLLKNPLLTSERRYLAIAAAMVPMYNRYLEKQIERESSVSEHIGTAGQKMNSILSVHRIVKMDGFRPGSVTSLILMRDDKGNEVQWKTGSAVQELEDRKGQPFEAQFKIKEHGEYKGVPNTAVTHMKVLHWLEAENNAAQVAESIAADAEESLPVKNVQVMEQTSSAPVADSVTLSQVVISVYSHDTEGEHDLSQPEASRLTLSPEHFRGLGTAVLAALPDSARNWTSSRAANSPAGEYQWYVTGNDVGGAHYSLHIHEVDGHEPVESDYRQIEQMLNVVREPELTNSMHADQAGPG